MHGGHDDLGSNRLREVSMTTLSWKRCRLELHGQVDVLTIVTYIGGWWVRATRVKQFE